MNILFVSAIMPYPLLSGGQIRIYNLLKRVAKHHKITLCVFYRKKIELQYLSKLDFVKVVPIYRGSRFRLPYITSFVRGQSLLLSSYSNSVMRQQISELLKKNSFDLVHIEPFYVAPSLPKISIPLVITEHNVEWMVYESFAMSKEYKFLRPLLLLESSRIKKAENQILQSASKIITVSENDSQIIKNTMNVQNIDIIPNGVDTDVFQYHKREIQPNPIFLFVGNFDWLPNREMLGRLIHSIWPAIYQKYNNITLRIVGRHIPGFIKLQKDKSIIFAENVEDIQDEYMKATALLSPVSISGGTKYKILEAMATGLPVITSKAGVVGLYTNQNQHVLIADSNDEYNQAVGMILRNGDEIKRMTQNARKLVEENYSWDAIAKSLEQVWINI